MTLHDEQSGHTARPNWRVFAIAATSVAVAIFIAANVHLVTVAVQSQPDCVKHAKSMTPLDANRYRAAGSSC